jgi:hypothetical protein
MNEPIPTFDYFVVRLNRSGPEPQPIKGLVERLGSGEKQPFDTAEHLASLLSDWTATGGAGPAASRSRAQDGSKGCYARNTPAGGSGSS